MKIRSIINLFQRLYDAISYWRVEESDSPSDKDLAIFLNRYLAILFVIFLFNSMFNLYFLGITNDVIFLFIISCLLGFSSFFLKKYRRSKYIISFIFIFFSVVITYYSSFYGMESGNFLFYFSLLSTLPIFFDFKRDRLYVTFLILFILTNLYVSAISNFKLVEGFVGQIDYKNRLFILNITSSLLLLSLNSFFLEEKKADYYFVLNRNIYKREKIENLNNEVIRLKQSLKEDLLTEENLHELIEVIQLNDLVFLKKFEKIFPGFFDKLNSLASASLIISDLKFCAMLKLGLTTKEIAIYTNSTIKSVEGKIYRLRKKLKISPDVDSKSWFLNI